MHHFKGGKKTWWRTCFSNASRVEMDYYDINVPYKVDCREMEEEDWFKWIEEWNMDGRGQNMHSRSFHICSKPISSVKSLFFLSRGKSYEQLLQIKVLSSKEKDYGNISSHSFCELIEGRKIIWTTLGE